MTWRPVRPHSEWKRVDLTYAAFSAASTTSTATIYTMSGNEVIEGMLVEIAENVLGGLVAAAHIDVGVPGDATKYIDSVDVFAGATGFSEAVSGSSPPWPEVIGTDVIATLNLTGDNADQLTAGGICFYIKIGHVPYKL